MILILEPSETAASGLSGALGGVGQQIGTVIALREAMTGENAVDTVVIGSGVATEAAFDVAHRLRISHPDVGIILVRTRTDSVLLTGAMRAGVREVVADHDLAGLSDAVARSREVTKALRHGEGSDPSAARARVLSVVSPKGGVGKTTLAVNVAVSLAQTGNTVAVLDLDLGFGDVPISLGLQPEHDLGEAIDLVGRLDSSAVQRLLARHESGVAVLASPSDPAVSERITVELIEQVLTVLVADFDFVVIDTAPALDDRVLAAVEAAERVLMPTTPDVAGIKNLKIGLDTLRLLGLADAAVDVVLNRSDSRVGVGADEVDKLLRHGITVELPSSRDVPSTTNRGVPIVVDRPRSPVSRAISKYVSVHLLGGAVADADSDTTRRWSRRRSA